MRRLTNWLNPVSPPAPRPDSVWRIITPVLLLPLLIPSSVLAYACVTDQGPWAADGYFGPGTFTEALVLLSPLLVWAASWLLKWEGEYDVLERRAVVCVVAGAIGLAICACFWLGMVLASVAGLGAALN
jgi:hypothetical protein